ncbi:hypothetical protein SAMN04487899_10514 [Segatella bryantii]|jgi:preprotein translocase subunit Sss1|nr:hypothetical protein SAMN04487899_10514 [Segatella bryantii]
MCNKLPTGKEYYMVMTILYMAMIVLGVGLVALISTQA